MPKLILDESMTAAILQQAREMDQAGVFEASTQRPFDLQEITLSLENERLETDPFPISFPFKYLFVESASDTSTYIHLKPNSNDSFQSAFKLESNSKLKFPHPIAKAYLHWPAQTGKSIVLKVSLSGDFESGKFLSVNAGGISINEGSEVALSDAVSVTTTATEILPSNLNRKTATVQNTGSTDMYIGSADVVAGVAAGTKAGIKVAGGASLQWRNTAALYAITAAGSAVVAILEEQ